MKSPWVLLIIATLAPAACIQVSADRIVAGDLAAMLPAFQTLDPAIAIGFTPLPGTQRILSMREILFIGRQHGLAFDDGAAPRDRCIEREVHPISGEELRAALIAALAIPDAQLEVIEFTNQLVPPGRLDFKLTGLSKPPPGAPETPVLWRGSLIYDGQRSFNIWAKVKLTVDRAIVVAAENIPARVIIRSGQIREERRLQFPSSAPVPGSASEIVGKLTRRAITAGQVVAANALEEPKDVTKGETIRVIGIAGQAVVSFDGIAETSGSKGETILIHNPSSGRAFRAVVEDKGRAVVRPTSGD